MGRTRIVARSGNIGRDRAIATPDVTAGWFATETNPAMARVEFHLTPDVVGLIGASLVFGAVFGAGLGGPDGRSSWPKEVDACRHSNHLCRRRDQRTGQWISNALC